MNQYLNIGSAGSDFFKFREYYSEAEKKEQKLLSVIVLSLLPTLCLAIIATGVFSKYFGILSAILGVSLWLTVTIQVFFMDASDKKAAMKFVDATAERYGLDILDNIELGSYPTFGSISKFVKDGEIIEALWTVADDGVTPLLIKVTSEEVTRDNPKPVPEEKADKEFTEIFVSKSA